jgi:foldase protein PrsA
VATPSTPSTPSDKTIRRRRKAPPRRVPSLVEQRERKPFIFGWGADLNHREREALKERIALYAGILLAVVLAIILGAGWYHDNVAVPNQIKAANNTAIAQIGNYVVRMGYFKHVEQFQSQQLNNQMSQIQQDLSTLQASSSSAKKNSAQISQLEAEQSTIQQELGSLADNSLTTLINNQIVLQRSATAGVPITAKVRKAALTSLLHQAGSQRQLALFENQTLQQTGLTPSEFQGLNLAQYVQTQVQNKLAKTVSHVQTEVRASHILIASSKKPLAEKLYHEVLNGANFAQLAKKYSTDPGSAKKGGDLGYFPHGQMVAPFDKAAFSMKVGQIRLVKSTYGWHIIKVTGRKPVKLTASQYQQAQQTAFTTWLAKEQAVLHVQRMVSVNNLPTPVSTASALSQTSSQPPVTAATAVPPAPSTAPSTSGSSSSSGKTKPSKPGKK